MITGRSFNAGRSSRHYIKILASIARKGLTAREVCQATGTTQVHPLLLNLRRLRDGGVVYVEGYRRPTGRSLPAAVFRLGVGRGDAPIPGNVASRGGATKAPPRAEMTAFVALVNAMASEPASCAELVAISGLNRKTIEKALVAMRAAGIAHRSEWDRDGNLGCYWPRWSLGVDQRDAPRPEPQSRAATESRRASGAVARYQMLFVCHALADTGVAA